MAYLPGKLGVYAATLLCKIPTVYGWRISPGVCVFSHPSLQDTHCIQYVLRISQWGGCVGRGGGQDFNVLNPFAHLQFLLGECRYSTDCIS